MVNSCYLCKKKYELDDYFYHTNLKTEKKVYFCSEYCLEKYSNIFKLNKTISKEDTILRYQEAYKYFRQEYLFNKHMCILVKRNIKDLN